MKFRDALKLSRPLILDGAMGTMLQASGLPPGESPEAFCLANPNILRRIHLDYLAAGADIITACTFGSNPFKLKGGEDVFALNKRLAEIARDAAREGAKKDGKPRFVAGNIGPSGLFVKPLGPLEPRELVEGFAAQARGLLAGGVDLILIETQFDLAEAKAAVLAVRSVCDLPIIASMTFEHGLSLTGSTPAIFAETMQNLAVDVIGSNCSLGPDEMLPVIEEFLALCSCPVMAEPNAGLPELRGNETFFPQGPLAFAEKSLRFAELGAAVLGGCCGTSPAHIAKLAELLGNFVRPKRDCASPNAIALTSRSRLVRVGPNSALALIGERINPTGKPLLASQLKDADFAEATRLADEQIKVGADVLDVNVGAALVDERKLLPALAQKLIARQELPLSLDSSDAEAIALALPYCPGSPLVNSISGEPGRMDLLGPLCRDYGAPFILLPLKGATLPLKATERIAIAEKLLEKADALGIPRRLVLVDILALSVSSSVEGGRECLEMARWCRSAGLPTVIGLSNISFGLPARELLNATFLALAAGAGLNSCIANPSAPRLRETLDAIKLLSGHDPHSENFIASYAGWKSGGSGQKAARESTSTVTLSDAVLNGDLDAVLPLLEAELAKGREPFAIVNETLVPAITEVGARYERKEYFLPQLIRSAETMQRAFARLKPLLEKSRGAERRPVIVMATVEGDIHDIGKNIVSLLLGNHGFEVIDAGKDVSAEDIVACAVKHKAGIIGLSALMTTTMVKMEDTIRLVHERALPIKVMVGGAAVTQAFADAIGADAYCEDAVSGVRAAKAFL